MRKLFAALATGVLILSSAASADEWPSRPVRMVNTFAAGGTADVLTRLVADHLTSVFKQFPKLKFIIPHGGGAVPFHWGRFRGLALNSGRPELDEIMRNNIFFDTCVYHQPGINLLTEVVPLDNILFASEMVGAVKGNDPRTGFGFDDTKRYVDNAPRLSAADRQKIFEGNARRVDPRLARALGA
jgi:4-oxalmesaconate hydratase